MARLPPRTDIQLKTDPAISYFLAPGEKLRQCPYEKSHMILENKFILHLNKCRRNYVMNQQKRNKEIEIVVCRFSSFHHVKKEELEFHEENCPTRLQEQLDASAFGFDDEYVSGTTVKRQDVQDFDREKEEYLKRQKEEAEEMVKLAMKAKIKAEKKNKSRSERQERPYRSKEIAVGGPSQFSQGSQGTSSQGWEMNDEDWETDAPPAQSWEEKTKDNLWGANFPGVKDNTERFEAAARKNIILNPQGLTKSEKKEYRDLLNRVANEGKAGASVKKEEKKFLVLDSTSTTNVKYEPDLDIGKQEEVKVDIKPPVQPRGRFAAVPVGYPGWELDDGDRRSERSYKSGPP